jgi:hypothetical protein
MLVPPVFDTQRRYRRLVVIQRGHRPTGVLTVKQRGEKDETMLQMAEIPRFLVNTGRGGRKAQMK